MRTESGFLDMPLYKFIRSASDLALPDAIKFVKTLLDPVKKIFSPADHKFSSDLLVVTLLFVMQDESDDALLEYALTQPVTMLQGKEKSDSRMMLRIASNRHCRDRSQNEFATKFQSELSKLSPGLLRLRIQTSYMQWRTALQMKPFSAELRASFGYPPVKNGHHLHSIRIGTPYELADAKAFATQEISPCRKMVDATTYEFAHSFFVCVALTIRHIDSNPTISDVINYATDKRWDSVTQQINQIENTLTRYGHSKTTTFAEAFCKHAYSLSRDTLANIIGRSHAFWLQPIVIDEDKAAKPAAAAPTNRVQIFNMEEVSGAQTRIGDMTSERAGGAARILKQARADDGYRTLPDPKKARAVLDEVKTRFENLSAPIDYLLKNLALSAAMDGKNFRVRPILLLGDPGIGKTYLAMELAESLSGKMEKVSASGSAFQLNGSNSSWSGGKCGQICRTLAEGTTTSPVFIVDEVDKMHNGQYPMLPVLLELLEPGTAACFKDEFFEMDFDASRIIFILTANDLDCVPEALRSRVEIFNVPRPRADQRLRIIKADFKELNKKTSAKIRLDAKTSRDLAERVDLDMRRTGSLVREAFIAALMDGKKTAMIVFPTDDNVPSAGKSYNRTKIGFLQNAQTSSKTTDREISMEKIEIISSRKDFAIDLTRERSC